MKPSKLVLLSALTLASGCAQNNDENESGSVRGVSHDRAAQINSKDGFDTAKDPKFNADTRFAAGQLAETQGNLTAALEQYKQALKLSPEHLPSLYRTGLVNCQLKKYPQAITAWKQYVKATDGAAIGYSNLGFCHELAGSTDQAESSYKKGIAKDPSNQPCRVNYGLMLARHGRTAEAVVQLQAVLSEAEVHYNLASIYEQMGRKEQAKLEYGRALELDPNLRDARVRMSSLQ